jgi:hypothetical protein
MQKKIDLLINKILNPLVKDYRYALLEKIITNNEAIFGAQLVNNITPYEVITFMEKKETKYLLKIIVSNSSVALRVDFQKEKILHNLALYTGEKNINKLRISHSNEGDIDILGLKASFTDRTQENILHVKAPNIDID